MGQPMADLFHPSLHLAQVKFNIVGEVSAHAGLSVAQSTVQRCSAHTDHHGDHTQQEEEQTGVQAHFIWIHHVVWLVEAHFALRSRFC